MNINIFKIKHALMVNNTLAYKTEKVFYFRIFTELNISY